MIIEDGITVAGNPLLDCYEATGHAKAYDYMLQMARSENLRITQEILLSVHKLFYSGIDVENAGIYRTHQVILTGTEYLPPVAEDIEELMRGFVLSLQAKKQSCIQ